MSAISSALSCSRFSSPSRVWPCLDLTREKAFTPSAEARDLVRALKEPVDVAYFYQKENPGARALTTMLSQLERQNPNFRVQLIDADQNPALASSLGVRTYNSAV